MKAAELKKIGRTIRKAMLDDYEAIAYKYDSSCSSGEPLFVVNVENIKQILSMIKLANKYRLDVVPRGGGTSLVGGAIPNKSIVIDLSKINPIKIDSKKKIAIVGAGATIAEVNAEAKKKGLFFPVEPASHEVCTVGGIISTNAGGLRAVKYGKAREWINRIDVIAGDGKILKNAKIDDFCGTEGVCGIIISAELKLIEIQGKRTLSMFEFENLSKCVEKAFEMKKDREVTALEFLGKYCSRIFGKEKYILMVEFSDDSGTIKKEEEIEEIWRKRDGLYAMLCKDGFVRAEDPTVPDEKLTELIEWIEGEGFPVFGHIGAGIMHTHISKERMERENEMWRKVKEFGGKQGEAGIGLEKRELLDEEERKRITKLKEKYDRNGILNRGKMI